MPRSSSLDESLSIGVDSLSAAEVAAGAGTVKRFVHHGGSFTPSFQDSPMDLAFFIRNRLRQLWLSSRDRACASSQAESCIASLQTGSNRTDLHDQFERVLQLPQGHRARLADLQRREHRVKKPLETTPITNVSSGGKQDRPVWEVEFLTAERGILAVSVDAGSGSVR